MVLAFWSLYRTLHGVRYADIVRQFESIPPGRILLALGLTALNFAVLSGYDWLAIRYSNKRLPYRKIAFTSFVSYAISFNAGFSILTGALPRYRYYSQAGLMPSDVVRIVTFNSVTFWLGLTMVGGLALTTGTLPVPGFLHLPFQTLRPVGVLLLLLLAAYLLFCAAGDHKINLRGKVFQTPSPFTAFVQITLASADWVLASSILYVLLPRGVVSYPTFLAMFAFSQIAGLASSVPGGVGVFEASMIFFLRWSLPVGWVMGLMITYRAIYYIIPLLIALVLLAVSESKWLGARLKPIASLSSWGVYLIPNAMTGLLFLAGAVLLFSGVTPGLKDRLFWLYQVLPLGVVETSHLLASVVGVALLMLARGVQLRLRIAYEMAMALLSAGVLFSLGKGFDYEEAVLLVGVLLGLWTARGEFYRTSALSAERFSAGWSVAVVAVVGTSIWLGLFSFEHVKYSHDLWRLFAPYADASRSLRAEVAVVAALGAAAVFRLTRPVRGAPPALAAGDLERAAAIIGRQGRSEANLALLGDKTLLFSESGASFLMYGIEGKSWVSMGDPVGAPEEQRELILRFQKECDAFGAWPVFYETGTKDLSLYLDAGASLSKLGEEARVPLKTFSLDTSHFKELRNTMHRVERTGCSFEIVPREGVPALLPELKGISDSWLGRKSTAEKGFSLGRFNPDYLVRFPAALIRREGRIVAFSNLWAAAPGTELSVDLMRFSEDAPKGVMDYLFTRAILWGQERGYEWFSLGMAPLAGLEGSRHAPLWNRFGHFLFRHGEHFYNFQGLRNYKSKFVPLWEPKYLASPGGLALPQVLADIGILISGGLREMLWK